MGGGKGEREEDVNTQTGSLLPAVPQPLACPHQECSVVVSAVHEGGESDRVIRVLRSEYTASAVPLTENILWCTQRLSMYSHHRRKSYEDESDTEHLSPDVSQLWIQILGWWLQASWSSPDTRF